jgi:hypothetical protein
MSDRNNSKLVMDSLIKLHRYIKKEKYAGWDPYDWYLSPLSKKLPKFVNFLMIQFGLYSPINFRPFFGIRKHLSNKGFAIFAQAYILSKNIIKGDIEKEFEHSIKYLLKTLEKNKLSTKRGIAWNSHYFKFVGTVRPDNPDIVGTTEALKAFSMAYSVYGYEKYKKICDKTVNSLLTEFVSEYNDEIYFKYTPDDIGRIIYNASALGLSGLSYYLKYVDGEKDITDEIISIGSRVTKFLLKNQKNSGVWDYSYNIFNKTTYTQIDYHQGFIIDGLLEFYPYISDNNFKKKLLDSIVRGVNYYKNKQFTKDGVSYYRYPIKYPIDIHNQAQGIITFSKLYDKFRDPTYLEFAEKIAVWTIKNMQSPKGYFYTHKWLGFVNKIPYMRWAQAWMMLALSTLLSVKSGDNNESTNGRPY